MAENGDRATTAMSKTKRIAVAILVALGVIAFAICMAVITAVLQASPAGRLLVSLAMIGAAAYTGWCVYHSLGKD